MQEIKFRAWDKKRKCYIKGWDVTGFLSVLNPFEMVNTDNFIIEQFTGEKDKNGKDIYENDIIKYYGYEVRNGKQIRPEKIMIVKDFIYDTLRLKNAIDAREQIEIIGNKWQNPELLK